MSRPVPSDAGAPASASKHVRDNTSHACSHNPFYQMPADVVKGDPGIRPENRTNPYNRPVVVSRGAIVFPLILIVEREGGAMSDKETHVEPDRAEFEGILAVWNAVIPAEVAIDDDTRRLFRVASDPAKAGLQRMEARNELSKRGVIVDAPKPPPQAQPAGGKTDVEDSGATPSLPDDFKLAGVKECRDLQAEAQVLGCLLLYPANLQAVRDQYDVTVFNSSPHARVFTMMCKLADQGKTITPTLLKHAFMRAHQVGLISHDLLHNLTLSPCRPDELLAILGILSDYAKRRMVQVASLDALRNVSSEDVDVVLSNLRSTLERIDSADSELPADFKAGRWPEPMRDEAFHGVLGKLVNLIAPRTEADKHGILGTLLTMVGSAVGRTAHWRVDGTKHYCNEFLVNVGLTSKARKGTGFDIGRMVFEAVDPEWVENCIHSGLASGEGLIQTVRDDPFDIILEAGEARRVLKNGASTDKRAYWKEDEFGSLLDVIKRQGSILSPRLRQAWQTGDIRNASKNSPLKTTGAHISVIGHITFDELDQKLGGTELSNGFANRFLWLCVKRANYLPFGGDLASPAFQAEVEPLYDTIRTAIHRCRTDELYERIAFQFTDAAKAIYADKYRHLSRTRLGSVGQVTDRAEAHVRRLAVIYALLDGEKIVDAPHINAAIAFWDYCEASCEFIFGRETVDPVAQAILTAVEAAGSEGLSATVISRKVFGGNKGTKEIQKALAGLAQMCLLRPIERKTGGRPATVWVSSS